MKTEHNCLIYSALKGSQHLFGKEMGVGMSRGMSSTCMLLSPVLHENVAGEHVHKLHVISERG